MSLEIALEGHQKTASRGVNSQEPGEFEEDRN